VKLCFLADARSPIAQNWMRYFIAAGYEVHVISSYPCNPDALSIASLHVVPVAFSGLVKVGGAGKDGTESGPTCLSKWLRTGNVISHANALRCWLGPLDIYRYSGEIRRIIKAIGPYLVHAMRIPFEGLLATEALRSIRIPLLISVWGNDLTLYAERFPLVARMTRRAMKRADALHPDCYRDLRLARAWGFDKGKPALVLPGSGGVQLDVFHPGSADLGVMKKWSISSTGLIVFYPRRFRPGSVRADTFFKAVPLVLKECPEVTFICVGIADHPVAERWRRELPAPDSVCLLPSVSRAEMADLFRLADVIVSPSEHDGTPNTLLEGMACGAFPVLGNIESVREWIEDGTNGLLCDPASPESLAQAILRALDDEDLRRQAAMHNQKLIAKRADYQKVMARAEEFYRKVIARAGQA
jgi:glycosyltransferase involved in cell wall biosynthesis